MHIWPRTGPFVGVWAPRSVSCPLTGAILPVSLIFLCCLSPQSLQQSPCNPEAQCLAATLTTQRTATCCVQSPHPSNATITTTITLLFRPCWIPKPPELSNPCLTSNHISLCSTWPRHYCSSLNKLLWNYLCLCMGRALTISIWCLVNEGQAKFTQKSSLLFVVSGRWLQIKFPAKTLYNSNPVVQ